MTVIVMKNHLTVTKTFQLDVKEVNTYTKNHESFGAAVHEITPSQCHEKLEMVATFMKLTEP